MGQVFFPDNVAPLVKASSTQITMASTYAGQPTTLTIGGQQYQLSGTLTLTPASVGFNGLDTGSFTTNTVYNIFAALSAGVAGLVCSVSTAPTGYTSYKFLGKFISGSGENVSHVMNVGDPFIEYVSGLGTWDANDTTSGAGIGGSVVGGSLTASRAKQITWLVPMTSKDSVYVEMRSSSSIDCWMQAAQLNPYAPDSTGVNDLSAGVFLSGISSSTVMTIQFARYRAIANDDSPQFNWNANDRYRVTKVSPPVKTP